jgi:hypothetical protein
MTSNQNQTSTVSELPTETIDFAHRMFDAARKGDADLLLAAVDAGLPPNLTNQNGKLNPVAIPTPFLFPFFLHALPDVLC